MVELTKFSEIYSGLVQLNYYKYSLDCDFSPVLQEFDIRHGVWSIGRLLAVKSSLGDRTTLQMYII